MSANRKGKQLSGLSNDPRWMLLGKALNIGSEQQTMPLATLDLVEGLRSGEIRCMRRSISVHAAREPVHPSFWEGLLIDVVYSRVEIRRVTAGQGLYDYEEINGWVYFVWKPDIEQLWPQADQERWEPLRLAFAAAPSQR